jgi:hypothetical protein
VATAKPDTRNDSLNDQAFALFSRFGNAGLLDVDEIAAAMQEAGEACGLDSKGTYATIRSAWKGGQIKDRSGELPDFVFEEPVPATADHPLLPDIYPAVQTFTAPRPWAACPPVRVRSPDARRCCLRCSGKRILHISVISVISAGQGPAAQRHRKPLAASLSRFQRHSGGVPGRLASNPMDPNLAGFCPGSGQVAAGVSSNAVAIRRHRDDHGSRAHGWEGPGTARRGTQGQSPGGSFNSSCPPGQLLRTAGRRKPVQPRRAPCRLTAGQLAPLLDQRLDVADREPHRPAEPQPGQLAP